MPLRAKISSDMFSRQISNSATSKNSEVQNKTDNSPNEAKQQLKVDDPDDVLFGSIYGVRTIELNRQSKLNSLNSSMAQKIVPRLQEWEKSQLANIIVIKGAGEKAFCAGGDVATLAKAIRAGADGVEESIAFFGLEYQLDHLISTYDKPYVAFMDGITMGGGVGLSVHAPFRVATERTVFAMPETTIGFFPDVGGSFFLSRLDGEIGTYLALTSERLKGVQALYAGIASHYIHSSSLPDLEARLSELTFSDHASMAERNSVVDVTIEEFVTGLPVDEPFVLSGEIRKAIDRCFRFDTIEKILEALHAETSNPIGEWATNTIKTLHERSPTSVRIALKQIRLGAQWGIKETFQREYYIASRLVKHPDFVEGVSARLICRSGERPKWTPPSLEETGEDATDEFFEIPEGKYKRLQTLKDRDYYEYPWMDKIGLPTEKWISAVIKGNSWTRNQLIEWIVAEYRGKEGVAKKVKEVVDRITQKDSAGHLVLTV